MTGPNERTAPPACSGQDDGTVGRAGPAVPPSRRPVVEPFPRFRRSRIARRPVFPRKEGTTGRRAMRERRDRWIGLRALSVTREQQSVMLFASRPSGLCTMLDNMVSSNIRWLIASFLIPQKLFDETRREQEQESVCTKCGDFGICCPCWLRQPSRSHILGEIYDLGLWCNRCHEGKSDRVCQCWRIRRLTRCQDCQRPLGILNLRSSFSLPVASSCPPYADASGTACTASLAGGFAGQSGRSRRRCTEKENRAAGLLRADDDDETAGPAERRDGWREENDGSPKC